MSEYLVAETDDLEKLETIVTKLLNAGWELQGGIAVVAHQALGMSEVQMRYHQALYTHEDD